MDPKMKNGSDHAPQNLRAWRDSMGYSIPDAVEALGVSEGSFKSWEEYPQDTPRYIKLACAALALGIKP